MCASNIHSYTHLILALGIVREPKVWVFITSQDPGTHDIGLPTEKGTRKSVVKRSNRETLATKTPIIKRSEDMRRAAGGSRGYKGVDGL